ncbi:hypothetical protein LOTGIDRAFT_160775 [Lottia gigantea]|uniref:C2H2-type domain-containing protein n=1 Tax=Lottia gigantea TaxID=225164 RepID=V4AN29_LOTGI|nr:hypothetical protein LOTGIDRAFT_160775 [Lottia gigantea]ESO95016.1 hypothetical protein LOTGIDRAFT_160775 [Lottia gigantea]
MAGDVTLVLGVEARWVKSTGYPCNICGKVFTMKYNLNTHIKGKHFNIRHKCPICQKEFTFQSNMLTHLKNALYDRHINGLTCKLCGQALYDIHGYSCTICGKVFTEKFNLRTHIKGKHLKITNRCHICLKEFSFPGNLARHMKQCHSNIIY